MTLTIFSYLAIFLALTGSCQDEPGPYLLDQQWKQMLDDASVSDRAARGDSLISLIRNSFKLIVPEWWGKLTKGVGSGERSAHMIEDKSALEGLAGRWNNSGDVPFSGFKSVSYSEKEDALIVSDKTMTLRITNQIEWPISKKSKDAREYGVAGIVHQNLCLIAPRCPANSGIGGPRMIYCLNADNGQVEWKAVLLTGVQGAYTNLGEFGSFTEVSVHEDNVVIWNGSIVGAIVQVFRLSDGQPLFRFSTNGSRQ